MTLLQQRHRAIHFLVHAHVVFKMAWYGDVCFKQRAVFEFLVAEKEAQTDIRKQLKNVLSVPLRKALLVVGHHSLQILKKAK